MYVLTSEQKEDALVKSLLSSDFSEETVAEWIATGAIDLAKSTQYGPDDHGEGAGDDVHEKRDKKQEEDEKKEKKEIEDEDEDADKDLEKGKGKKDCDMGGDNKPDIAKSLGLDAFYKSMSEEILGAVNTQNEEILKSIPAIVERTCEEYFNPVIDRIEKSMEGMKTAIELFGKQAPSFKTSGLSQAIIEKSIAEGGGIKDQVGKTSLSASRDRLVVRELILKSIQEEEDKTLAKSLNDNAMAYILDPIGGAIGEPVAQYLYEKKGVRLVK